MVTGLLGRLSRSFAFVAVVAVPMGLALLTPAVAARQATPAASPIASPVATSAEQSSRRPVKCRKTGPTRWRW